MSKFLVVSRHGKQIMLNVDRIISIHEYPDGRCKITTTNQDRSELEPDESYHDVVQTIIAMNMAFVTRA